MEVQTYMGYQLDMGSYATVSVNWNSTALNHTLDFVDLGIAATENQTFLVRDLLAHENLGEFKTNITLTHIPPHGSRAL